MRHKWENEPSLEVLKAERDPVYWLDVVHERRVLNRYQEEARAYERSFEILMRQPMPQYVPKKKPRSYKPHNPWDMVRGWRVQPRANGRWVGTRAGQSSEIGA